MNARFRSGLDGAGRHEHGPRQVNTCDDDTLYNQVNANTGVIRGPDPRGCNNVEPWQTTIRGLASYTIPKIDVLVSTVVRSQPSMLLGGTPATSANWQVPNSVIAAALGHLPPGATATGTTNIPLGRQRAPRLRRRAPDAGRHALREDRPVRPHAHRHRRRLEQPVQHELRDGLQHHYIYNTDNTPRPSGWGTPTSIYNPRFVRLNFTVNF